MPRVVFVTRQEWERIHSQAYQRTQADQLQKQNTPQEILACAYGGSLVTALDVWLGKTEQRRLECWVLVPKEQYLAATHNSLDDRARWARDYQGLKVLHQGAEYVLDSPTSFLIRTEKSSEQKIGGDDLATMPLF
jgi:hypothetical protein